jgi:hypothetical protein
VFSAAQMSRFSRNYKNTADNLVAGVFRGGEFSSSS